MGYDPLATGAAPGDDLVRRGMSWESAKRLATQAAAAEKAGVAVNAIPFGHGVSVTSPEANQRLARDPSDAVQVARKVLEGAGFEIRDTPTRSDTDHHTVQLPKPVTEDAADLFNTLLGRRRK